MVHPEFDLEMIFGLGGFGSDRTGAGMFGVTPFCPVRISHSNVVNEVPPAYVASCFAVSLSLLPPATCICVFFFGSLFMTGDPPLLLCSVVRRFTEFAHGISERSSCSWRVGCVAEIWASG